MRSAIIGIVAISFVTGLTGICQADLIGLTQAPPDITTNFGAISYNATTHLLTVSATPVAIDYDGGAPPDYNILDGEGENFASYSLTVKVDSTGHVISDPGNILTVTGMIDKAGETFQTLLTGTVTEIGYQTTAGSKQFEFEFDVTGGTQASVYGSYGGVIYVAQAYNTGQSFSGGFGSGFSSQGTDNADTFLVTTPAPEPVTLLLMGVGGLTMIAGRRLGRRRKA